MKAMSGRHSGSRGTRIAWPLFLLVCLPVHAVSLAQGDKAQEALPTLRAESRLVDIQDGDRLLKGIWTIDPAVALDVYLARRTSKPKRVTFITDVDSLSFDVQPGRTYDFVILLKGTQACHTRLSTLRQGCTRTGSDPGAAPATLPVTIREGKVHCQGRINGSEVLDLIFDTA